jgi:Uma2 family endonuclease
MGVNQPFAPIFPIPPFRYNELKSERASKMSSLVIPTYAHIAGVQGPPQGQWTAADWEALPNDGNRYEIINGVLFMSTAPSYFHQWIILRFYDHIGAPAQKQSLAHIAIAPVGVFMPNCQPVQPDFIVVLKHNAHIIRDRRIYGVLDLIVEVISPGSRDFDEDVKKTAYEKAGVPEYVVIDPEVRQLRLYTTGHYDQPQRFNESDTVTFSCLPTLSLVAADLFNGAPDTTL